MTFIDIILGTPWYIWVIFIYLLIIGIKNTKPNIIPLWRLAIMPLIFIIWSLYSIYVKCTQFYSYFMLWNISLVIGILTGYIISSRVRFKIDSQRMVHMPGSFIPLIISMIFFVLKYVLGVTFAIDPILRTNLFLICFDLILSGLISGIFLGRFGYIFNSMKLK